TLSAFRLFVFYWRNYLPALKKARSTWTDFEATSSPEMIIESADDQTVAVLADMESVRAECEAVDVESGAFQFFDELGRGLRPRFVTPVSRTPLLFGIGMVSGGNFELDLDE